MSDGTLHIEYSLSQKDIAKALEAMSPRIGCPSSIQIYVQTVQVCGRGILKEFCMFQPKLKYSTIVTMSLLGTAR